jgi:FAD/FMN-containing dehydrogenase
MGGIVIDLCNMNKITEIDERNMSFTAQAGVSLDVVDMELRKGGFCYPVHPVHDGPKPLGSEVAKCTAGTCRAMFGHVSKRLIGLEVVLGNGDILETGSSRVNKNTPNFIQSGIPDLTQLFVASEGAFGVITEVTMHIYKFPVAREYMDFKFEATIDGLKKLVDALHEIRIRKLACSVYHFDIYTVWLGLRALARAFPDKSSSEGINEEYLKKRYGHLASITVESLFSQEECDLRKKAVMEICEKHGGEFNGDMFAKLLDDTDKAEENLSRALFVDRMPATYSWADTSWEDVPELYEKWIELLDRLNFPKKNTWFGIAFGEESCQPMPISYADPTNEKEVKVFRELNEKLPEMWAEIGAVPYRIGRIWRPYILDKLNPVYLEYIRDIKRKFDPNNIMNPGVSVFEEGHE